MPQLCVCDIHILLPKSHLNADTMTLKRKPAKRGTEVLLIDNGHWAKVPLITLSQNPLARPTKKSLHDVVKGRKPPCLGSREYPYHYLYQQEPCQENNKRVTATPLLHTQHQPHARPNAQDKGSSAPGVVKGAWGPPHGQHRDGTQTITSVGPP